MVPDLSDTPDSAGVSTFVTAGGKFAKNMGLNSAPGADGDL